MKNLVLGSVVAVSSLFAITACANVGAATDNTPRYNTMPHAQMHGQMYAQRQNMMSDLNLTADQQAKIHAIRQNNRGNRTQNHDAMMQVLTPEQRQKLQQMQSQRMSQGGRMMNQSGHHMNQGRGGRMTNQGYGRHHMNQSYGNRMQSPLAQLNLTADQQAKIQAIRQNNRGTGIQNHDAIMQVLTPEQRQKLQQMQSQRMNQGGRMMNQGQN